MEAAEIVPVEVAEIADVDQVQKVVVERARQRVDF